MKEERRVEAMRFRAVSSFILPPFPYNRRAGVTSQHIHPSPLHPRSSVQLYHPRFPSESLETQRSKRTREIDVRSELSVSDELSLCERNFLRCRNFSNEGLNRWEKRLEGVGGRTNKGLGQSDSSSPSPSFYVGLDLPSTRRRFDLQAIGRAFSLIVLLVC